MARAFKCVGFDGFRLPCLQFDFEDSDAAVAFAKRVTSDLAVVEPFMDFTLVVTDEDGVTIFET